MNLINLSVFGPGMIPLEVKQSPSPPRTKLLPTVIVSIEREFVTLLTE